MTAPDYKSLSRGISDDMSPRAISRRLDIANQLYKLAKSLSRAEYVGPVEPADSSMEVRESGPDRSAPDSS